jgi:hypothetical protein
MQLVHSEFYVTTDSTCHIWENTCAGQVGHCWLYNNKSLRYGFNLAAAGNYLVAFLFKLQLQCTEI